MNYYKVTKIPKNKYILDYEIKKDIIVIKLANNEKYILKNIVNNENKILERMNKQVSLIIESKKNKKIIDYIVVYGFGFIGMCVFGYQAFFNIGNYINGIVTLSNIIFGIISIISILYIVIILKSFNKENKDLKKIKLYCETKKLLNNNIQRINVFNKVSFRTIKRITDKHMDKESFTINSINKMSLRDLQTLKDNIEREKDFGLEEEPIVYKTRAKKKINH